jgi:hypothetical protein
MAKTCLKVLNDSCIRLWKYLLLEAFACLEVWPLGHNGSILLSIVAQALLCNFLMCRFLLLSLLMMPMMTISGKSRFLSTGAVAGVELLNEVFTSRARWIPLIIEWNTSTNVFYLLKQLLLLILVIFKLKCNNLIFNEIMIFSASCVRLLHSWFVENHLVWILKDGSLIFEVVLSQTI